MYISPRAPEADEPAHNVYLRSRTKCAPNSGMMAANSACNAKNGPKKPDAFKIFFPSAAS